MGSMGLPAMPMALMHMALKRESQNASRRDLYNLG